MRGFLDLDATARAHLVRALESHRLWCRTNRYRFPPELDTLARSAGASDGQERTDVAPPVVLTEDAPVALRLPTVASRLSVSQRTVSREVAAGRLPTVRIGSSVRVLADDLERYLAQRRSTTA